MTCEMWPKHTIPMNVNWEPLPRLSSTATRGNTVGYRRFARETPRGVPSGRTCLFSRCDLKHRTAAWISLSTQYVCIFGEAGAGRESPSRTGSLPTARGRQAHLLRPDGYAPRSRLHSAHRRRPPPGRCLYGLRTGLTGPHRRTDHEPLETRTEESTRQRDGTTAPTNSRANAELG